MGDIIDFSKYKEEIESKRTSLFAFFKEKGADDELAHLAEKRSAELFDHLRNLGQYSFPVTLPGSLNPQEQQQITAEVRAGVGQVQAKLEAVVRELAVRTFVAELKVFQYERLHRNGF